MDSLPKLRHPELAAVLLVLSSAAGFAQDDAGQDDPADTSSGSEAATEAEAPAAADAEDDLIEDPELDVQGFDPTADDDFVPSEDIPADAPIAFPTDI